MELGFRLAPESIWVCDHCRLVLDLRVDMYPVLVGNGIVEMWCEPCISKSHERAKYTGQWCDHV